MPPGSDVFEPYPRAGEVWRYLRLRFGLDLRDFPGLRLWHRRGAATVWIAREECLPPSDTAPETIGLPLLRRPLPRGFPTTAFLQRFGLRAWRSVIHVADQWTETLMRGEPLPCDPGSDKGPYIVRTPDAVLGRGWVRRSGLVLDVAKEWRRSVEPA